jgi:thiol-disulfide isomerase/thioredoxin
MFVRKWLIASTLVASAAVAADSSLLTPGMRKGAPSFTLSDSTGKAVRSSDYKGKVVLVNFWATWCGPCKIEIPWFIEFEKKYKDKGLVVLGVSMDDEGWPSVKTYMEKMKIGYPIMLGNEEVAAKYGGMNSLPVTVFVDREGRIAARHVGLVAREEYEADIRSLLTSGPGH